MPLSWFNSLLASLALLFLVFVSAPSSVLCAEESSTSVRAENAFFSGCNLLAQSNVSQAIPDLENAVESDPENSRYRQVLAVAYNNLGLRLTRQGNVRNGILFLAKALNVVPDDKEIRFNFVQAVWQAVTAPEEKITVEDKVAFLKQVIEIEPGNTAAQKALAIFLNNWGVAKGRTGDHEEEIVQLTQASSIDPENTKIKKNLANAYYNLALTKGEVGHFQDEVNLLRKALELLPGDQYVIKILAAALSNLAVVKGKEGDITGQISLLKESFDLFSGDFVTKTNLAAAYNNYAMAENPAMTPAERIANLEMSLKLDPKNEISKSNYCNVAMQEAMKEAKGGSFNKTIEILKKAARVDPENKTVQTKLVEVYGNRTLKKGGKDKHREKTRNSSESPHTCRLLKEYLKRLVAICSSSTDAALDSKLALLKAHYQSMTVQMKSAELKAALAKYEKVCRCINRSRNSGTSLKVIYSRNLCGSPSTKRMRTNIINRCRGRRAAGLHK